MVYQPHPLPAGGSLLRCKARAVIVRRVCVGGTWLPRRAGVVDGVNIDLVPLVELERRAHLLTAAQDGAQAGEIVEYEAIKL